MLEDKIETRYNQLCKVGGICLDQTGQAYCPHNSRPSTIQLSCPYIRQNNTCENPQLWAIIDMTVNKYVGYERRHK